MSQCPCTSGKEYADCCEPLIYEVRQPATAEELMRARYSAYAMSEVDFLYQSSVVAIRKEFDHKTTREWADNAEWNGIEFIRLEEGGEKDERGLVEFVAHYTINGGECRHHEIATFSRVRGVWKFEDGEVIGPEPVRREEPKVGRNDPCPCGSGKKHKKCCGSGG